MKRSGLYSSGEFARKAHITKKTLRYYDEHDILKPSYLTPAGARYYSEDDLTKLQQILLFKYLGFSLDDIREMTINGDDRPYLRESLNLQKKLVEDRIEQLQVIAETLDNTIMSVESGEEVDCSNTLDLIHMMGMEKSLKNQYQNASNIISRISLHSRYSRNQQGWFPWIFEQCDMRENMNILEVGCGDGTFWTTNRKRIPSRCNIFVTDLSEGMLRDAKRSIGSEDPRFQFSVADCQNLKFPSETFDMVVANHVLFYCEDISAACAELFRVLRPGGKLVCSTYGSDHMIEITNLVKEFDDRIVLSGNKLYEKFGRENGAWYLEKLFSDIEWRAYSDELVVNEPEPLLSYILSCHGNQNQYILDRYKEFRQFVRKKTERSYHITKDAGIYLCIK